MCGIAGFWQTKRRSEFPLEILNRMGAVMAHRGPDDAGVFHDNNAGIGFAFRRLSIIDVSPQGHQPMSSSSGRYILVFNGEVYNHEEIRKELGNVRWRGHSDTEVILEAIEQWGLDRAVRRFVGMFAFALWDRRERKLFLVRDRLGIKPLYYGRAGGDFVFASELKAIAQYPGFQGRVDREALALYIRHNYVPSPHCIYSGLCKLQPGCILTVAAPGANSSPEPFWSAYEAALEGTRSPFSGTEHDAVDQLRTHLLTAVRLRMIADVPLGAFLSGGVDSSLVVSLMQAESARPVKTFTVGFLEDEYSEAAYAKKVAAHLGTEHTELYVTPQEAQSVVPSLSSIYDEPFADSSQIPTYLVSKLARGNVTVSLSGDGGDELFGGYNRYLLGPSTWSLVRRIPKPLRSPTAKLLHSVPEGAIDSAFNLLRPVIPRKVQLPRPGMRVHNLAEYMSVGSRDGFHMRALSHWEDPSLVIRDSHEPDTVWNLIAAAGALRRFEESMMLCDLLSYLPDDILTKVDRASMAVGLEARVPLLDHRLVEFAWKLPLALKIRGGLSKWILRQVLYRYIPSELIERPKMGFAIPIDRWLRGPLRDWAEELLSEERLKRHGFFHVKPIRTKWKEHLSGAHDWKFPLWGILIFQDWYAKAHLSAPAPPSPLETIGGKAEPVAL